jgi:hypothetical protein
LSPFAAKRLTQLLQNLMREYESRYGTLPDQDNGPKGNGAAKDG